MSSPTVSVIIPTYNRSALVKEAVASAIAQTFDDIEILVIDDGSTDDTETVIGDFSDRVRYFRKDNAGVNSARNLGLREAQGEFVALLDSDDLWEPYKIELQLSLMRQMDPVAFCFTNFAILRSGNPEQDEKIVPDGLATWLNVVADRMDPLQDARSFAPLDVNIDTRLPSRDFGVCHCDIYGPSLMCPYVLPSTSLIRRSMIPSDLTFPEFDSTCGDWDFFARLSRHGGALYIDLDTTFNRSHEDAVRLTRIDAKTQLERRIAMIDRIWRSDGAFYAQNSQMVDTVQRRLLVQLGKLQLLASRRHSARENFRRAAGLGGSRNLSESVLRTLAMIPGAGAGLNAVRDAWRVTRRLLASRHTGA